MDRTRAMECVEGIVSRLYFLSSQTPFSLPFPSPSSLSFFLSFFSLCFSVLLSLILSLSHLFKTISLVQVTIFYRLDWIAAYMSPKGCYTKTSMWFGCACYICMNVWTLVCMCVWRPEVNFSCFLEVVHHDFFFSETSFLIGLKLSM